MFRSSIPQIFTVRPRMIGVTEEADTDRMNTVFVNADAINYIQDQSSPAKPWHPGTLDKTTLYSTS